MYVRETWAEVNGIYLYKADNDATPLKWHPSIHMPKDASRITLEVVNVRLERLQEITEDDAWKEGVGDPYDYQMPDYYDQIQFSGVGIKKCAFAGLWDSINAKRGYGWDSNPWVWVVEFRRVEE